MEHVDPFWMTLYSLSLGVSLGVHVTVFVMAVRARRRGAPWVRPVVTAASQVVLLVALPVVAYLILQDWFAIFGASEGWTLGATVRMAAPGALVNVVTAVSAGAWIATLRE